VTFSFWRRPKRDEELEEELRSHLEMAARDRIERGEAPERARSEARREFGDVGLIREVTQDKWGWRWLDELMQDVRYGLRMMRRSSGFCAVAILILALGIGANTAIFSLADGFLLKSLPAKDPQQLVFVSATRPDGGSFGDFPYPVFEQLRDRANAFSGMFAWDGSRVNVTVDGQSEIIDGDFVSGNYFNVLGVDPLIGRLITADDDRAGKTPVAVISYAYWKRQFAEGPAVLGKTIYVGPVAFTVIGVTSPQFFGRNVAGKSADAVLPMWLQPQLGLKDHDTFDIMARIKPGVSVEQGRADLEVVYQQLLKANVAGIAGPAGGEARRQHILLKSSVHGYAQPTDNFATEIHMLAAVVGIALLIACVNVAGLLLARASSRRREIAVRVALGAGRGRLVRQSLSESLLLAMLGGALGLVMAKWAVAFVLKLLSYSYSPIPFELSLDFRVLAFTAAVSTLTGLFFGLAPALTGSRVELNAILKGSENGREGGLVRRGLAKSLVAAQVALSLVLLMGAGLLLRSLKQLYAVNTGYERDQVLTMWVFPALNGYDHAREMSLYRELYEKLTATPGVESASLSRLMMVFGDWNRDVWVLGAPQQQGSTQSQASRKVYCDPVGPGFFRTMGIGLLLGREFSPADSENSQKVTIVSESFARKFFPGENALGRRIGFDGAKSSGDVEIVGVVKDIRHRVDQDETREAAWIPYTQAPPDMLGQMVFLVRTAATPATIAPSIRSQAQSLDKTLPLSEIQREAAELDDYFGAWRSMGTLMGFFSGVALVLAALGLYGAMSYLVGRRRKELGIRLALGAQKRGILWMVLREAFIVLVAGIAVGVPFTAVAGRWIASMLFGVRAMDPATMASVLAVMAATALLAAYLPARRAMRVDPIVALRYE
jgi:predicted permease